jgi:hypothetical protein
VRAHVRRPLGRKTAGTGEIRKKIIAALPYSIRVLLESCLRNCDGYAVMENDVKALAIDVFDSARYAIAHLIDGIGIPDYSARGLTQTLEPIEAAISLRRTINGGLKDLSFAQFRKYKSTISCHDQEPPAVDGVWPGHVVTIDVA